MATKPGTGAPKELTAKEKREAREAKIRQDAIVEGRAAALADLNKNSILHPDRVAAATGEVAKPQHAGDKVIVACKLGVAYYDIQHSKIVEKFEQNMQGGKTIKEANRVGAVVRLRGTAYPRGTPPQGFPTAPIIVNGAALTMGVDRAWFEEWLDQHKLDPIVMNKMVFAHATLDGVTGEAKDLEAVLSGLDPINPKGDARIPKSSRPGEVLEIEAGQRQS